MKERWRSVKDLVERIKKSVCGVPDWTAPCQKEKGGVAVAGSQSFPYEVTAC